MNVRDSGRKINIIFDKLNNRFILNRIELIDNFIY
jgi:hypothetical protein